MIDEASFDRMKKKNEHDDSTVALNEHNQGFIENRVLKAREKEKNWKEVGDRLKPLISEGIQDAGSKMAAASPPAGGPVSGNAEEREMIAELESVVDTRSLNKTIKLYYMLKAVPGVEINKNGISVDGQLMAGTSTAILINLVKPQAMMTYSSWPLLEKILDNGMEKNDLRKIIGNKEAREWIDEYDVRRAASFRGATSSRTLTPISASTPELQGRYRSRMRADEEEEEDDDDGNETFSPGRTVREKRGSNKRPGKKWQSMFASRKRVVKKKHGRKSRK